MSAKELDKLTWPEIRDELAAGRDTVVIAFGATEQHGPHMAMATDALIGDHMAALIAEELDAFVAPTVRVGCSSHHLAFAGTLSFSAETFHAIVADLVASLARGGFRRVVMLASHGGNFGPLQAAIEKLGPDPGIEIVGMTDLGALATVAQFGAEKHGVPVNEGGLHGGEWETSMMLAIAPDLVHMSRGEAGYTGDPMGALAGLFEGGVDSIAPNGVLGDPSAASAENGRRYWAKVVEIAMDQIGPAQGE
ncbi:MAG: creatinine amidohydrolase [Thermoleophilaceae bacterium]|jgi:creatinine amidohydrolase|nr:creatinine amidohydrolase [Thermoleophilaceae bacterium]